MKRRDQFEEAQIMLGTASDRLKHVHLRISQAHDRHGLTDLFGPALDESLQAMQAIGQARKVLKKMKPA